MNDGRSAPAAPAMTRAVFACWLLLLVAGIVVSVLSPPFSSLDEPPHFFRTWAVSRGDFFAHAQGENLGSMLPCGLRHFIGASGSAEPGATFRSIRDPELRALSDRLRPGTKPEDCFTNYPNSSGYTPLSYIPPAAAMWVARLLDAGGIEQLLVARIANLVLAWLIIGAALKVAPVISWSILALSALPMTAYLRSVHVTDSLLCALSLLLVAAVVRSIEKREPAGALGIVTGALICLLKPPYLPLALVALLPGALTEWRRRALGLIVLVAATLLAIAVWQGVQPSATPAVPGVPSRIEGILASPLDFAQLLADDVVKNGAAYRMSFVGVLGRLDAPIGPKLRLILGALLTILILLESQRVEASPGVKIVAVVLMITASVAMQVLMYLSWTPPGFNGIRGVQGRYFIPIVPVALMALPRLVNVDPRVIRFAGAFFVPFSLAVTITIVALRYWA